MKKHHLLLPTGGLWFAAVLCAVIKVSGVQSTPPAPPETHFGCIEPQPDLDKALSLYATPAKRAFIPPAKVRHLVVLDETVKTTTTTGSPDRKLETLKLTHEFWYGNGSRHPLVYARLWQGGTAEPAQVWVEADRIYDLHGPMREVSEHPYYPVRMLYLEDADFNREYPLGPTTLFEPDPDLLTGALRLKDARILGNSNLLGRRVTVVGTGSQTSRQEPAAYGTRLWIEDGALRLLKIQHIKTIVGDSFVGPAIYDTINHTMTVTTDELKEATSFPADFFVFKRPEGAQMDRDREVGRSAPDLELENVKTGQKFRLSSLKGKPLVLNFWGPVCALCRAEMAGMQKVYGSVKQNVEFVGVSQGAEFVGASPADSCYGSDYVRRYVSANGYAWLFARNLGAIPLRHPLAMPTFYFIDKNGVTQAIHVGTLDPSILQSNILKLMR